MFVNLIKILVDNHLDKCYHILRKIIHISEDNNAYRNEHTDEDNTDRESGAGQDL